MGKAVVATELAASAPLGAAPATGHGSPSRIALRSPWLFFEQLSAGERRRIFTLTPSSAQLLAALVEKGQSAQPGQFALFEWPFVEHTYGGLSHNKRQQPKPKQSHATESEWRRSLLDEIGNEAANDTAQGSEDADHVLAGDEDVRLQASIDAGSKLLWHARILSLDNQLRASGMPPLEGVTCDQAWLQADHLQELLSLALVISGGRFLSMPPDCMTGVRGPLRPTVPPWLAATEAVHAGSLLLAMWEAALWAAYLDHLRERGVVKMPSSVAATTNPAVAALEEMLRRAQTLRDFACAHGEAWPVAEFCFPSLAMCARPAGVVELRGLIEARRAAEVQVAEESARRLLLELSDAPAGGGNVANSGGGGGGGGGSRATKTNTSGARRRKKARQQERQREATADGKCDHGDVGASEAVAFDVKTQQRQLEERLLASTTEPMGAGFSAAADAAIDAATSVDDSRNGALATITEIVHNLIGEAVAVARVRQKAKQAQQRRRAQATSAASAAVEWLIEGALRDALRREKKRAKAQLRRAKKEMEADAASFLPVPLAAAPHYSQDEYELVGQPSPMQHRHQLRHPQDHAHHHHDSYEAPSSSAPFGDVLPHGESPHGGGSGIAAWMESATRLLLAEMEQTRDKETEGERATRRLLAIEAAESERARLLSELVESEREERSRRAVMRAAASAAAEGERRRRIHIQQLEEEEDRRTRQLHQTLAIQSMETERARRVSLHEACDASLALERVARQKQAKEALERERQRRARVLRTIEESACTVRQQRRSLAVLEMEHERQRRLHEMAVGSYELANGLKRPASSSDGRAGRPSQQWAAFASGVAKELGEEEQAERSRRRQWAAAAAQSELERSALLGVLSSEVEQWAAAEQRRLRPLQEHVWRMLRAVAADAQSLWASARVELFGSWAAGLQLSSSDVDLLVCDVPISNGGGGGGGADGGGGGGGDGGERAASPAASALRLLTERLAERPWVASIKLIETARVPVIKLAAALPAGAAALVDGGQLQLDISLEGRGHTGAASRALTRDVLLHLPQLQPIVLVLKRLLTANHLNSAASGGLGSYALVLMATSLLQQHALGNEGVGPLLVRFLQHFSSLPDAPDALHAVVLDTATRRLQAKRVRRGDLLSGAGDAPAESADAASTASTASEYEEAVYSSSLLVQDPLEARFSNVSDSAFRWSHVQALFSAALERVQSALGAKAGEDAEYGQGALLVALLDGDTGSEE